MLPPSEGTNKENKGAGTSYPNALKHLGGWTPNKIQTCGVYYLEGVRNIDPTKKTVIIHTVHETYSRKYKEKIHIL